MTDGRHEEASSAVPSGSTAGEVPGGLPMLSRGMHCDPDEGSCLMEYVSVLAGEPFSDHPACTHPALAELARDVNDAISNTTRPRLAELAPALIGTQGRDPAAVPELVRACAHTGLAMNPDDPGLRRALQRSTRSLVALHDVETQLARARRDARRAREAGALGLGPLARLVGAHLRRAWQRPHGTDAIRYTFIRMAASAWRLDPEEGDQRLVRLLAEAVADHRRRLEPAEPGLDGASCPAGTGGAPR